MRSSPGCSAGAVMFAVTYVTRELPPGDQEFLEWRMIRSDSDARLLLFVLMHEGVELAGEGLRLAWERVSRRGRLKQELRVLMQARFVPGLQP